MIKLCLEKKPSERPNCEKILNHDHFKHFSNEHTREQFKTKIKVEICDEIDNVGRKSHKAYDGG